MRTLFTRGDPCTPLIALRGGPKRPAPRFVALLLLTQLSAGDHQIVRLDVYPMANGQVVSGLTRDDFEVVEDGTPQKVDSVVHVGSPAAPARGRVFVLFIDTYHAKRDALRRQLPVIARHLDPLIRADDRVAIVTPETSSADVALAPRPAQLEAALLETVSGGRGDRAQLNPDEKTYLACFETPVAMELIARRRQKITLDALQDLVAHLRGAAPGRKAVLVVSGGWNLFPAVRQRIPAKEGRRANLSLAECERDRAMLGQIDQKELFDDIAGEANRAGVSFYTVATTGSHETLAALAEATDGTVVDANDAASVRRVADDTSSYYVIAYRPSRHTPDGKVRRIKVRALRPGIDVRSRASYRAPVAAAERTEHAAGARPPTLPDALHRALLELDGVRRDARLHVRATAAPVGDDLSASAWIVGELDYSAARLTEWAKGGEADITLLSAEGKALVSTRATIEPGARTVMAKVTIPPASDFDGSARVRIVARPAGGGTAVSDLTRLTWPDDPHSTPPVLLFRRGPVTAQRFEPAADPRFRQSERVRIQLHGAGATTATGRVVNRAGQPTQVPVIVTSSRDADGSWIVAELALAPLTPGDYAIELTVDGGALGPVLVPVRVIP